MQTIGELTKKIASEKPKNVGERHVLIGELYEMYLSPTETICRKKENWKRYVQFLKENRIPNSKENQAKFKKSKKFLRVFPISLFAKYLAHIPTKDLYFCISYCKDKNRTGNSCASWLFSKIK